LLDRCVFASCNKWLHIYIYFIFWSHTQTHTHTHTSFLIHLGYVIYLQINIEPNYYRFVAIVNNIHTFISSLLDFMWDCYSQTTRMSKRHLKDIFLDVLTMLCFFIENEDSDSKKNRKSGFFLVVYKMGKKFEYNRIFCKQCNFEKKF